MERYCRDRPKPTEVCSANGRRSLNDCILNLLKYGSVQDMYDNLVNKANLVQNFLGTFFFHYMFRATCMPIIRINNCIYATLYG